ncbi:MAG: cation:proton antiporter [Bryobacterales bacterium]|nr:cation:proton antiporter [Bryobacterales bacterium]
MGIASDFVLIVIAGLCGGLLARLLRLPLLVGYVAAGVAVGPYTAGPTVTQLHEIELLAEIGVALLLFSLGLEISLRDLQPVRRIALIGGPIQVVLTAAAGALAGIKGFGMSATEGIWFGAMVAVSSTMVVLRTLSAAGLTSTLASRVMIGLLVIQDLAVIPILIILPQIANLEGALPTVFKAVGIATVFLAAMIVAGTRLLPKLLQRVIVWGSRELFLVAVVAIGVGLGYAAHAAGLSFALGAFVAGMILSESEFSHQALSDVVPLRDIFGLLFFVSVGMLFDPNYVLAHWGAIAGAVLAIFIGKSLIFGFLARAFGYTFMAPWIIGLGLSQIGEFSFVLARSGLGLNAISKNVYDLALTCTILTMALSPIVSSAALPLGRAWRRWRNPAPPLRTIDLPEQGLRDHVVVAGYGRTGRAVAKILRQSGVPLVIVDSNYPLLGDISAAHISGVWGDATREEVLHAAQIPHARVLVITIPDRTSIELIIQHARQLNPSLEIVARAVRDYHIAELRHAGVDSVIQPEFEGGVEMVRQTLARYRYGDSEIHDLVACLRDDLYGSSTPS